MRRWPKLVTGVALAACMLLLASCSPGATLPEPNTETQVADFGDNFVSHIHSMYPDAELPEVEFEEFLTEWNREEVLEPCFDEYGVEVSISADGGMSWAADGNGPDETMWVAMYACSVRYPDASLRGYLMNQEERAFLYDYSTAVVTPCVRSAGYAPPRLPDRHEYVSQQVPWSAYNYMPQPLGDVERLRWSELLLRCPELPAGWDDR